MDDCIFCKIIKGEIPCTKVYEDDDLLAFLDIAPVNRGHTLIIPKEHHQDLLDMPEELVKKVAVLAKKIGKAAKETTNADGFNIGQNNGAAAGQAVFHFHLHVIPRFNDDGLPNWPRSEYKEGEAVEIAQKISQNL